MKIKLLFVFLALAIVFCASTNTNAQSSYRIDGVWQVDAVDTDEFGHEGRWHAVWQIQYTSNGIRLFEITDGLLEKRVEEFEVVSYFQKGRYVEIKLHIRDFMPETKTIKLEFMGANSLTGTFVSVSSSHGVGVTTKGSISMRKQ